VTDDKAPMDINEALLALQADPPVLTKNREGQAGSQKTKYADLVHVNQVVLSKLNSYGVAYIAQPTMQDDGRFVLAYELLHVASGTSRKGNYPLKLSENSQQMGSAISYARRYALLAVTGIAAEDEDDDGRSTDGRGSAQRSARRASPEQQGQVAQRRPSGPPLPSDNLISQPQMAKMQAMFAEQGITTAEAKKAYLEDVVKHPLASTKELTKAEAKAVIDRLESDGSGGER
jgi:hypothetical protein